MLLLEHFLFCLARPALLLLAQLEDGLLTFGRLPFYAFFQFENEQLPRTQPVLALLTVFLHTYFYTTRFMTQVHHARGLIDLLAAFAAAPHELLGHIVWLQIQLLRKSKKRWRQFDGKRHAGRIHPLVFHLVQFQFVKIRNIVHHNCLGRGLGRALRGGVHAIAVEPLHPAVGIWTFANAYNGMLRTGALR